MRKLLMITSAILGLGCLYPTTISAQTCTAAPSCADMGYTKTVSDCSGKNTIKCPFDLTKVSCEDEDSSSGSGQWDWENMILCSKLTYTKERNDNDHDIYSYTAPAAGCFFMQDVQDYVYAGVIDSAGTKKIPTIAIGGPFTLCVEKNFIVQGRGYSGQPKCYFIPYK